MSQDPTQNDWSCDSQGTDVPHGTSHNALETNHEKTPGDIRELLKDNLGVSERQLSLVPDGQLLHAKEFLADARVPPHVRFPIHERIVEPQEELYKELPIPHNALETNRREAPETTKGTLADIDDDAQLQELYAPPKVHGEVELCALVGCTQKAERDWHPYCSCLHRPMVNDL